MSDQIRLWEVERNRLEFSEGCSLFLFMNCQAVCQHVSDALCLTPGVLYSEFLSAGDFDTVRRYAEVIVSVGVHCLNCYGNRAEHISSHTCPCCSSHSLNNVCDILRCFLTKVVVGHVQPGNEYWIKSLQHVLELAQSLHYEVALSSGSDTVYKKTGLQ